jgi:hypothetical protein
LFDGFLNRKSLEQVKEYLFQACATRMIECQVGDGPLFPGEKQGAPGFGTLL